LNRSWTVPVIASILILGLFPLNDAFAAVFTDSFSVAAQGIFPTGLEFSADGLTMFVVGGSSENVNEYACGSAFDVSTCSFTDSFSVAAQGTVPWGLAFSADGLTMFVVSSGNDNVNEYACGSAFDVSTCSFTDSFSVAAQDTVPNGLAFSADGLTMFVVGGLGSDVNEYACGSAFDVSTCSFTDSFSVAAQGSGPNGVEFSTDGLTMFMTNRNIADVQEYACGSAFDVSTCTFTESFSVNAQEGDPNDVAFSRV